MYWQLEANVRLLTAVILNPEETYMSAQYVFRRSSLPVRLDAVKHAYTAGQSVRLKADFNGSRVYRIISRLPIERDSLQYRIRSDEECHERVAAQENLEPIVESTQRSDLTTRIFREVTKQTRSI